MKRIKSVVAVVSLLAVIALLSAAPARAGEPKKITLVTTTSAVKGSPLQLMQESLTEVFAAKGRGWFEFDHFDSSTLFKQDAEFGAVKNGDVDMSFVSANWFFDNGYTWFNMYDAGFIFKNLAHQQAVYNPKGEIGKMIVDKIWEESGHSIRTFGATLLGTRTLWLRKKDTIVNVPADLARVKLRMSNSAAYLLMGRALGAQPTPLDGNEVYLAMQTGAIDAQENVILSSFNGGLAEVCESIARTDHALAANNICMYGPTWEKMTPEQQALFEELVAEAIALTNRKVTAAEERVLKICEEKGIVMQYPDRDAFRKHVLDYYLKDPASKDWDLKMLEKINQLAEQY